MGVDRQSAGHLIPEFIDIEMVADHYGSHSGAAIGAWNSHSVGGCIDYARTVQNRVVNFAGCNIFALPAEGIAEPINKIKESRLVAPHQITGTKPGVAWNQHVTKYLLFGFAWISIALKAAAAAIGRSNPAERFTCLASFARNAKAIFASDRNAGIHVDPNYRRREPMGQEWWNAADRTRLSLNVVKREITFGSGIELQYLRHRKTRLECLPNIAPQSVAARQPKPMFVFI